jgi:hypothetical protein
MPHQNNFQHSTYSKSDPGKRVGYRTLTPGAAVGSPAWFQSMAGVGEQLVTSRVKGVVFLNGHPFTDLFGAARLDEVGGLKRGYSRGISGLESLLALLRPATNHIYRPDDPIHPPLTNCEQTQQALDALAHEAGNFTSSYVRNFEHALGQGRSQQPLCARYVWSSLNHHVGRVEAAIYLLLFLQKWSSSLTLSKEDRILLIGHGHAGQVLALLSNIIASEESEARARVFEILATYWQACPLENRSVAQLEQLYRMVMERKVLEGASVDVVTLGTPIRYGWDMGGIGRLLHVVNHRVIRTDGKRWLAKMELPQIAWEMPYQTGGDYVQQLAVAGTDALPDSSEAEQANAELREILEPYDGFERWLECTRRTTRCANDGQCLLVEYGVHGEESPRQHLFGHACYTQSRAMLFLATETAEALYS